MLKLERAQDFKGYQAQMKAEIAIDEVDRKHPTRYCWTWCRTVTVQLLVKLGRAFDLSYEVFSGGTEV